MTHFTCLVGFLYVFAARATASFNYVLNCPVVHTEKVDPKMYEGNWYDYTHSSGLGYTCQIFNESNSRHDHGNFETYYMKTKLDNGTIVEDTLTTQTPPLSWPYSYLDQDKDGEWVYYVYDVEVSDDYWLEYACFQIRNVSQPMLFLNTRGLTAPKKGVQKMEEVNKQYNLNLTFDSNAEKCTNM